MIDHILALQTFKSRINKTVPKDVTFLSTESNHPYWRPQSCGDDHKAECRKRKFDLEKPQDYVVTADSGARTGDKFAMLILATTILWC